MPNNIRHVWEISFDNNNTDVYHICDKDDIHFNTDEWTNQTSGISQTLRSVYYAPEKGYWVACGDNGTILKSSDGETWTDHSVSAASPALTFSLRSVKYWKNYWWIVGYGDSSTQATILQSTDGESWTSLILSSPVVPSSLVTIGFSDDVMIFGGWTNPYGNTSAMSIVTRDGSNFEFVYHSAAAGVYGVDYNYLNSKFMLVGSHESTDATPWATITSNAYDDHDEIDVSSFSYAIYCVVHTGDRWIVGAGTSGMEFKHTAHGRVWHAATFDIGTSGLWPWRVSKDTKGYLYVACGNESNNGSIYVSEDNGETFSLKYTSSSPNYIRRVEHGQDYMIAVGDDGSIVKSGTARANIFYESIIEANTVSQSLPDVFGTAEIGKINVKILDKDSDFTKLLNDRILHKQGLRAKRIRHYIGETGYTYPDDYTLVQTQQFYGAIGWSNGAYQLTAQDVQRSAVKTIFDPKTTTLLSSVSLTDDIVNVSSTLELDDCFIQHGGSYSDAPNKNVLYAKINKEVMRFTSAPSGTTLQVDKETSTLSASASVGATVLSITDHSAFESSGFGYVITGSPETKYPIRWTGKSSSPHQLTGVSGVTVAFSSSDTIVNLSGRGALDSRVAEHNVDTNQDADKRTKVQEFIYYEMPVLQMLYYVLTGNYYGNSPAFSAPSHHTLGIASQYIATAEFINPSFIDFWDTSDDTAGLIFPFFNLKKQSAKKFYEEELLRIAGFYMPVLQTGELGLRRRTSIPKDAPYDVVLNKENIESITNVRWDMEDIYNEILVNWNYDYITNTFTRPTLLQDNDSITSNQLIRRIEINSKGLNGSIHSDSIVENLFNIWRDRHAYSPFKAALTLSYDQRALRVGDIVRIDHPDIPEFMNQNRQPEKLAISAEVQRVRIDHKTNKVTIDVLASSFKSDPIVLGTPTANDAAFTTHGTDLSTMLGGDITGTDSGGILTITGGSLTGVSDLNGATALADNSQGRFYYDGDVVIDGEVAITDNVWISATGTVQGDPTGYINGIGGGHAGTSLASPEDTDSDVFGTVGYIGITKPTGGAVREHNIGYDAWGTGYPTPSAFQHDRTVVNRAGPWNIVNTGNSFDGVPGDLRPTSGGRGRDVFVDSTWPLTRTAIGGNGGNGGASLVIAARNAIALPGFKIDLSGNDGSAGALDTYNQCYAGSGAGGAPGVLALIIASTTVSETISQSFIANSGDCPILGNPIITRSSVLIAGNELPLQSADIGYPKTSFVSSHLYVHYITEARTAAADTPSQSTLPTKINIQTRGDTANAVNQVAYEFSVTPPSGDTGYKSATLYIRTINNSGSWDYIGEVQSTFEIPKWLHANGDTYIVKAHSVSIKDVESDDYITESFTTPTLGGAATQIGNLVIDGSNLIVYNTSSPREEIQKIDLVSTGVMTGTIVGSGDQANEQLVPNNRFNFLQNSPQQPMAWKPTEWSNGFLDIHYITTDSPDTEGSYLVLPNPTTSSPINKGYNISCKTFKLVPGRKYRARIRARAVNVDSPIDTDGFYFRLQYGINYAEYFGFDGPTADPPVPYARDGYNDFIEGTETVLTELWDTYEYDITIPATYDWGNIAVYNWNHSNAEFHVAWVEFMPWGVLQQYVADFEDDYPFFHIPIWQSAEFIDTTSVGTNSTSLAGTGGLRIQVDLTSTSNYEAGDITLGKSNTDLSWDSEQDWKLKVLQIPSGSPLPSTNDFWVFRGSWTAGVINGCGFWYDQSAKQWYTFTGQNTASITTTAISPLSDPSLIRIVIDNQSSPREVRFYVDGTLVATHTDDIPSGTGTGYQHVLGYYSDSETGGGSTNTVFLGEFKFKWN